MEDGASLVNTHICRPLFNAVQGNPMAVKIREFLADANWITQQEVFLHLITMELLLQISLQHRTIVDAKFNFVALVSRMKIYVPPPLHR